MKIQRKFTQADKDVFESVEWTRRSSRISNLDGSTVFEMKDVEVPASWSQLATDIMVSKYFRKAGVPQTGENGQGQGDPQEPDATGPEHSVRQVVARLAGCWRHFGQTNGYFDTDEDGQAFQDEMAYMLLEQMGAPNSPQWFNTGLHWAYGITGPAQGHWTTDPRTGETKQAENAYSHPQPHACFIQSIEDDLVNPGGIMDLWVREARLFKYGSGTGTNFSKLRGETEPLSGGGKSSGLMSWLKIGDRAAGAIKSGGTTRRAAKMVCLDLDHPDVEAFIKWKVREELKVAAMVAGLKHLSKDQQKSAEQMGLTLDYDFNSEAYQTVSGQNANNSVRITDQFFKCLDDDGSWDLIRRTDGKVAKQIPARQLWDQIADAAWQCADPGVQFDSTINQWHTCPKSGRINASNPCSEYMFLDNTACNLASLNLLKFFDAETCTFDLDGFEHAVRLWTIVLEISVLMAAFPSREIARLSYAFRTLGLGYTNLGALLMQAGIPYDTPKGRAFCGAITGLMTGRSYATSAELASQLGPFPGYFKNRSSMLRVIANHRRAAYGVGCDADEAVIADVGTYEGLDIPPVPIDASWLENDGDDGFGHVANRTDLLKRVRVAWDEALERGRRHGYRNAQTTVVAPTGTIGLLMDCDTTGVEPDFALVKFKKLAGGGYFKIANQSLKPALRNLGYADEQIREIATYVMGSLDLNVPMPAADGTNGASDAGTFVQFLKSKGLSNDDLKELTEALPTVFELAQAFNALTTGSQLCRRLGAGDPASGDGRVGAKLLEAMGLTDAQLDSLHIAICGTQTIEGAPHLKPEHLPVFDCANLCGPKGKRFINVEGHIRMMAAAQPFISGAISKTVNLPHSATVDDMKAAYRLSWELALKATALYRDGCKLSQPLSSGAEAEADDEDHDAVEAAQDEVAHEVAHTARSIALRQDEPAKVEKIVERIIERPMRRRLPATRKSITHKFEVAGHEGYLTVGLYDDGGPGELFITMAKEGSTIGGLMDSLGTAISVALQYGVPVESLVTKFTHQRFEPAGITRNQDIPFAKSLVDYIFRWLGMQFVPGYRVANAPVRQTQPLADKTEVEPAADQGTNLDLAERPHRKGSGNGNGNGKGKRRTGTEDDTGLMTDPSARIREPDSDKQGQPQSKTSQSSPVAQERVLNQPELESSSMAEVTSPLATALNQLQADAPACDVCGTITVRSGTCYKCLNCGNSMGCS